MPYSVQLPDGRIVDGIPDDMPQSEARKKILESFPDLAATQKRGWGEAATDIGASLVSGVGQLAQMPGQVAELAGLSKPTERDTGLQGIGRQLEQFGQEAKSPILKGKETVRAQKIDQAEGLMGEFGTAIKETIKDPALLSSFFAEQVPNLIGSWGGGLLARGTTKALMRTATEEAIGKAGLRGAVGTGAVMQGADIGADTYETAFKELKKQGYGDEEATGMALAKGRIAALEGFGLSLASAKLPGGATIEQALAGQGVKGGAKGFIKGLAEEAASEAFEEGSGKFASNVNVKEIAPETSLTKGVGSAAGMGALGGGLFGGVAGHVNAARDQADQDKLLALQNQKQEAQAAIDAVIQAEDQARRDAFEAEQAQIKMRALREEMPERFRQSEAYAELEAKVEKAKAARDKADQAKDVYKQSAFHEAQPDLLGDVMAQREAQTTEEAPARPQVQEGQMELPFTDQQGQMNLPGMPTPEAPVQQAEAPIARPVTEADFKTMKIGSTNKKLREELLGKDLNDPAQVAEVRSTLENWVQKGRSEPINKGVGEFLDSIPKPLPPQEQGKLGLRRPYGSLKKADTAAPTAEEQAILQAELQAELGQTETQNVERPTESIPGVNEPSVRVPSERPAATTGTEQTERRGMVPVGSPVGRPIGGEAPVAGALTTPQAQNLNKRQVREYEEAAANYMVGRANDAGKINTVERSLDYVAGDLHSGENLKEAKRFHRGLSEEQKAYVQKKIDELQALENKDIANRYPIETMQKNENERLKKQEAKRKIEDEEGPLLERVKQGAKTDALVAAVQRGDLAGALLAISKDPSETFNVLEKLVSNRLLANKGTLPKIEIVPAGTIKDGAAQYNPFTDTVQINEGEVDSHTVLHETVHGFLHTLIEKFENEKGIKNKGIADMKALYDFIKENHPNVAKEYGMSSLTEFASELMSNRDFQSTLAQIPYRLEHQSLFTAFIRAVLNALGLSPTQKLSALARGLMAAEQSMAQGRNVQQMRTGVETGPVVKVNRDALAANYAATGAVNRAPATEETGPFQTIKDSVKSKEAAKSAVNKFLNTAETMFFSADAALNNAIRAELESTNTNWDTIKQMMFEVSTSQATHADAVAMQFLQHGDLEYDPKTYKWKAKDDAKNSWSGMVHQLADIAKKNGLTTEEITNYAQQAFVAERLKGLSQSKREVYSHMNPAQIEAGIKFFDMIPELRELQKTWNAVRKNAMNVAVQAGLYNEAQSKELLDIMDYVPFYRIEQLAQNAGPKEYGRGLIDFAKGYKIAGSEQEVANIFDNMERWTSYTVSRAVKNRSALNLYQTAKKLFPDEVKDLRQDERVKREQNTIDLWVDGQRQKVEFKDPLFVHAFTGIESAAIPHFGMASSVANILRKNIVLMPLFSISQLSQDSFGAMLTSGLKHPWALPLEVAKEFTRTLMGRSKAAEELSKYGAVGVRDYSATFVRESAEILAGLKEDSKSGKFKRALENFAMASDNAVRQAIYNMTMKETGDKATAVERAFEIINFKRAGASGKIQMLRQVVPFFGAYLQAQNVIYKTLSGKGISPQQKKEAQRTLAANALKIGALAFMYAALCADDDEYQKMDPSIRDHHLLIPGTAFMLPLRQDLTIMPKLIAEYAYLGMTDNAFTDGKKIQRAMSNSLANAVLSPTAVPQAVKPLLEVATNHSFFTGRSIIGQHLAGLDTEKQYTSSTSEFAKFIGSSGLIAPVNVDHLIKGYLGTTGGLGLQATNAVVNGTSGQPRPEKSWQDAIASTPGLSAFVAREYGNADKNDYYELRDEVSKAVNTLNDIKKHGTPEEAKAYFGEKKELFKVKDQVNTINRQLTQLRAYERQIIELPESKMNAEKKGQEIERIRKLEDRMLGNVHKLRQDAGY